MLIMPIIPEMPIIPMRKLGNEKIRKLANGEGLRNSEGNRGNQKRIKTDFGEKRL